MPKARPIKKKLELSGRFDESATDINKTTGKRFLRTLNLNFINGMSNEMAASLRENGILNVSYISSGDPLKMYDELRDSSKSPDLQSKWDTGDYLEYRHLVFNALNLAAMKYLSMEAEYLARVDTLCPAGVWLNSDNGISRFTAFVMVDLGLYEISALRAHSAMQYYEDASKKWMFSKLEGLDYYTSIKRAKWHLKHFR